MLRPRNKKTRLSLPNKTSLGIYTGYGGSAGFTRATTKTCRGYLENALPGDPQYIFTIPSGVLCFPGMRFIASDNTWSDIYSDGNVIDEANLGVLIEPATTNLFKQSVNVADSLWVDQFSRNTRIADFSDSPFLSEKTTKIIPNIGSTSGTTYIYQSYLKTTGETYTLSFYVKYAGFRWVVLSLDVFGYNVKGWFDIQNGVLGTLELNAISSRITPMADGYLIELTGTGSSSLYNLIMPVDANNSINTTGDGIKGLIVAMPMLNVGRYRPSYIPTTTSTVTCNADIQTIQTAQNINRYQGSLSFEFTPTHNAVGTVALGGSKQDDNNYVEILQTAGSGYIFRKCVVGVQHDATLTGDFVAGTTYSVKIKWSTQNGMTIFINGTKGVNNPNTAPLPLGSVWYIGADGNGGQQAGACFKNVLTKYK